MRTIVLHGELGEKFGKEWTVDVASPAEAFRAIEANSKGFFQYLIGSSDNGIGYQVKLNDRIIDENELGGPLGEKTTLHVIPMIGGAGKGWGKVVVGALLVTAAIVFSGGSMASAIPYGLGMSYGNMAMVGVALMFAGASSLLAKPTDIGDNNPADNKPSYVFNGPVNTVAQGGVVPVGYGRLIVGSQVISGGIVVNEIDAGTGILREVYNANQ